MCTQSPMISANVPESGLKMHHKQLSIGVTILHKFKWTWLAGKTQKFTIVYVFLKLYQHPYILQIPRVI